VPEPLPKIVTNGEVSTAAREPRIAAPCCKSCGSGELSIEYGKYGYNFKCKSCAANTALKIGCEIPGHKEKIRKSKLTYYRECEEWAALKSFTSTRRDQKCSGLTTVSQTAQATRQRDTLHRFAKMDKLVRLSVSWRLQNQQMQYAVHLILIEFNPLKIRLIMRRFRHSS
jgi:hypothetical protein